MEEEEAASIGLVPTLEDCETWKMPTSVMCVLGVAMDEVVWCIVAWNGCKCSLLSHLPWDRYCVVGPAGCESRAVG